MDFITWLQTHFDQLLVVLTSIVTAASVIAAITPTPADDTAVGKLYKIIDTLALNFGRAKDLPAEPAEPTTPVDPPKQPE